MHKPYRTPLNAAALVGLVLLLLVTSSGTTFAAPASQEMFVGEPPSLILLAEHVDGGSNHRVFPSQKSLYSDEKTATIVVNYSGSWDPAAKAAFEYAKGIWETQISSPVPIVVDALWKDLNYISSSVLGGTSAADYTANFSGAPVPDTWYPIALANKLANADLRTDIPDIEATFNSGFPAWYFGVDGNPPNYKYDFVSVVLHEVGHGLGFTGSMRVSNKLGNWGVGTSYPFIYDRFIYNGAGISLLDTTNFPNQSPSLCVELTSNNLYFSGANAVEASGGNPPKLYAPPSWAQGSSYSHLDENSYSLASGNALMTPALMNGEVIHDPGPITLGIFEDMGWGYALNPLQVIPPSAETTPQNSQSIGAAECGISYKNYTYFPSVLYSFPIQN